MWVSAKLDTLAPFSEATFEALKERHPDPHPESIIASIKESQGHHAICVTEEEVAKAIRTFPKSLAGGLDGLRPQHLKDMISEKSNQDILLPAITSFVQLVLEGRTPVTIRPFFFGANLTALSKEQGGICPIAMSCMLLRLVAKVAGSRITKEL